MIRRFAFAAASVGLLVSFAAKASQQTSAFTVPVSVVDGYAIVDVRLNGDGPFHFVFDTGAGIAVLDPAVQKLALKVKDWGDGVGDGEHKVRWRRADVRDVQVGRLHFTDRVVGVLPTDDVLPVFGTYPLSGFIGAPLLRGMAVKLDYVHQQLTFTPADQFSYSGSGTILPFANGHIPVILDGTQQSFFVDTGTNPGVTLGTLTCAENDLPMKYNASVQGVTDWGAGGPVHSRLARGHLFELGNIKIRDPVLYLSVQKAGLLASEGGRLGWGLLSRFDVTFDTSRSRAILEKNSNFSRPDTYDRLGMWMGQAGQRFVAVDVVAGGPADTAGVKPGDTILEIDGASTASLVLPVVREQIERRSAGDHLKLLLQSGGRQRVVVITFQDRV
jgi:hypothetical protein